MILGALIQKLCFQDDSSGHLGFGPLAKNAGILGRDLGLNGHGIEVLDPTHYEPNYTSLPRFIIIQLIFVFTIT